MQPHGRSLPRPQSSLSRERQQELSPAVRLPTTSERLTGSESGGFPARNDQSEDGAHPQSAPSPPAGGEINTTSWTDSFPDRKLLLGSFLSSGGDHREKCPVHSKSDPGIDQGIFPFTDKPSHEIPVTSERMTGQKSGVLPPGGTIDLSEGFITQSAPSPPAGQ